MLHQNGLCFLKGAKDAFPTKSRVPLIIPTEFIRLIPVGFNAWAVPQSDINDVHFFDDLSNYSFSSSLFLLITQQSMGAKPITQP